MRFQSRVTLQREKGLCDVAGRPLSDKQRQFIEEYLGDAKLNGTVAYRRPQWGVLR
jgi:hypothetical protein